MSALNHPPEQPLFEFLVELATLLETGKMVCADTCPADAKSLAHSMRNYAWIVMNQVAYNQLECEKCLAEVRAQLIRARALVSEYKALLYGVDSAPDNAPGNASSPVSSPASSQEPGVPSERGSHGSQRPVDRLPKQRKGRKRKESGDEEEEDGE